MSRRMIALLALAAAAVALLVTEVGTAAHRTPQQAGTTLKPKPKKKKHKKKPKPLSATQKLAKIKHIVVIYEENHSFDNLYGGWEGVNGRANADAAHTTQ